MFLLSKLESFSNNFIEAWRFGKPLILTDAKWARAIAGNSAHYAKRDNTEEISYKTEELIMNNDLVEILTERGRKELLKHPKILDKTISEIAYLEKIAQQ